MLYDKALQEHQRIQTQITAIQQQLKRLPDGKIICSQNGNRVKWYKSDGHTKTYLPKKQRSLAEQLAIKKYLSLVLEDLLHEQRALNFYLSHHSKSTGKSQSLLTKIPGYQELLSPYFQTHDQKISQWLSTPYDTNPKYPEQLVHKTSSGTYVRSKSEAMIALYLHTKNIPFRYECALSLGETIVYPDFTILHPRTYEIIYWEHYGLMDEAYYYQNVFSKLQLFTSHGIVPSINLITTYETKKCPLCSEMIEKIVDYYFE